MKGKWYPYISVDLGIALDAPSLSLPELQQGVQVRLSHLFHTRN